METATITVEQAAQVLGINRMSAYTGVHNGEIPSIRIGRRILVPKAAFQRMLEGAGQRPERGAPEAA